MHTKLFFFLPFFLCYTLLHAQQKLHRVAFFPIGGNGGWDYLTVEPQHQRLYVAHGTQVNVLDINTGDSVGVIPHTNGVHGIAFVPWSQKGFTSNGKLNNVTVFNANDLSVISEISVGENPDAIFYDDYSKCIITCNGKSQDVSFIDTRTLSVTHTIALGGKPETAVSDLSGKLFINLEDKNEVVVVDEKTFSVMARWNIKPGEAPTGLAIDTAAHQLFVGCGDNAQLMVLDTRDGHLITQLPIGDGCDGVAYDAVMKTIYASNGEGNLSVIRWTGDLKTSVQQTVATQKGARTLAVDKVSHKVYLPVAEYLPITEAERRPKIKPGSFGVLVYSWE